MDTSVSKLREIVKDREAWRAAAQGVAKRQTRLSGCTTRDSLTERKQDKRQPISAEVLPYLCHGTTDWFQIGKGVRQGSILSPCLFNFYAECITRNAGLEEAQAGINTAGRNINNLRYADDTILMAESKEELKSILMKMKDKSEKA